MSQRRSTALRGNRSLIGRSRSTVLPRNSAYRDRVFTQPQPMIDVQPPILDPQVQTVSFLDPRRPLPMRPIQCLVAVSALCPPCGRVSPLTYFNQSNRYCTFQNNSVWSHPAVVPIQAPALKLFPYGTWGGRLKVAPTKGFYAQAGILKANPSLNVTNGFDWSTRNATGYQTAFELGFHSSDLKARNSLADRRLSQHLRRRRSLS